MKRLRFPHASLSPDLRRRHRRADEIKVTDRHSAMTVSQPRLLLRLSAPALTRVSCRHEQRTESSLAVDRGSADRIAGAVRTQQWADAPVTAAHIYRPILRLSDKLPIRAERVIRWYGGGDDGGPTLVYLRMIVGQQAFVARKGSGRPGAPIRDGT